MNLNCALVSTACATNVTSTSRPDCDASSPWPSTASSLPLQPLPSPAGNPPIFPMAPGARSTTGCLREGAKSYAKPVPAEKVALTKEARRIIAEKVTPQPPWAFPPEISSQECLKAIEHAGGVTIRHRGEELHITEIVTRGTHWWSGDRRLTPGAKRRLTNAAREILKFRHSWRAAAM